MNKKIKISSLYVVLVTPFALKNQIIRCNVSRSTVATFLQL